MAMEPSRFYRNLISSLERSYLQHQAEHYVWRRVRTEISSKLKLEILFDCRFSEALKQYFKQIKGKLEGSQAYLNKIKYIDYVNRLFYSKSFTSKRQYERTNRLVRNILDSPCIQWQNNLTYLKSASSLREFREDFLYRYCGLTQQEIEVLLEQVEDTAEGKQKLKSIYEKFFKDFLEIGTNLRIANFVQTFWSQWQSKTEMLSPDLIQAIQKHLGGDVGRTTNEVQINSVLLHTAQENTFQNDSQVKQRLQNEVKIIQKALQKFSGLNILKDKKIELRLGKFGSIVSGFAGLDADLDLTILTNCYVNELQLLKIIYQFLKKQYQVGDRRSNGRRVLPQLISTAKTPLIAITISQRGHPEIKIDIIVNNILGILNSKFLNVYAGVRWIRNLGILVKMWGKNIGLIGKSNFSSYSIILMLIHYLIKSKKANAIMDARGRKPDTPHFKFKRMKLSEIEQFDVYYNFKTKSEDVAANERVNYLEILLGFMRYYGQQLENDSDEKNRIITVDLSTDCQVDKETAITIKDPFDKPHNPGRLKKQNLSFMVGKFKEAHEILTRGDVQRIKDLFSKY